MNKCFEKFGLVITNVKKNCKTFGLPRITKQNYGCEENVNLFKNVFGVLSFNVRPDLTVLGYMFQAMDRHLLGLLRFSLAQIPDATCGRYRTTFMSTVLLSTTGI